MTTSKKDAAHDAVFEEEPTSQQPTHQPLPAIPPNPPIGDNVSSDATYSTNAMERLRGLGALYTRIRHHDKLSGLDYSTPDHVVRNGVYVKVKNNPVVLDVVLKRWNEDVMRATLHALESGIAEQPIARSWRNVFREARQAYQLGLAREKRRNQTKAAPEEKK